MKLSDFMNNQNTSYYHVNRISRQMSFLLSYVFYKAYKSYTGTDVKLNHRLAKYGEYFEGLLRDQGDESNFAIEDIENIIFKRFDINSKIIKNPITNQKVSLKELLFAGDNTSERLEDIKNNDINIYYIPFSVTNKLGYRSRLPLPYNFFTKAYFIFSLNKYFNLDELLITLFNVDDEKTGQELIKIHTSIDVIKSVMDKVGLDYYNPESINNRANWENFALQLKQLNNETLQTIEDGINLLTERLVSFFENTESLEHKKALFAYLKEGVFPAVYNLLDINQNISTEVDSIVLQELKFNLLQRKKEREVPFTQTNFYKYYSIYNVNTPFTILLSAEAGVGKTTMVNEMSRKTSIPKSQIDAASGNFLETASYEDKGTGYVHFIKTYVPQLYPDTKGTLVFLDEIDKAIKDKPEIVAPLFAYLTSERTINEIPVVILAGQYFEGEDESYCTVEDFVKNTDLTLRDEKFKKVKVLGSAEDIRFSSSSAKDRIGNTLNTLLSRMFIIIPDMTRDDKYISNKRPKLAVMHTRQYNLLQVFVDTLVNYYLDYYNVDRTNKQNLENIYTKVFDQVRAFCKSMFQHYINFDRSIIDFPEDYKTISDIIEERLDFMKEYLLTSKFEKLDVTEKKAVKKAINKDEDILYYLKYRFLDTPDAFRQLSSLETLELFNIIDNYIEKLSAFSFQKDSKAWAEYYFSSIITMAYLLSYLNFSKQKHDIQQVQNIQENIKNSLSALQFQNAYLEPVQRKIVQMSTFLLRNFTSKSYSQVSFIDERKIKKAVSTVIKSLKEQNLDSEILDKFENRINELVELVKEKEQEYKESLENVEKEPDSDATSSYTEQNSNTVVSDEPNI
ncbi:hypothetical protein DEFDS_P104 (plasmid) [Deferribacter desulfuricans SSM1]|uniref:Uncharacterized protein n=1 Tax=Deferribacter desulfuricans (strain DSM 14783 / JCM 11476 / NBRC 101012 / SSM1) TaxID=639282 RepID=D3PET5_DEFDS|nr:ATP-binding protein [Deferribacter desulfuricans]BAI81727.1 hypothetical protein DEFDS_P104 [Deferribacter desulfuricans SSM1]